MNHSHAASARSRARFLAPLAGVAAAALTVATASAQTLPAPGKPAPESEEDLAVIRVNREVGLGVSGNLSNYKEKPQFNRLYGLQPHDRELGWIPGMDADASTLFRLGGVRRFYASLHFGLGDGDVGYNGGYTRRQFSAVGTPLPSAPPRYVEVPDKVSSQRLTTQTRGEFGRGFLIGRRFLITPVAQGGYMTWNRSISGPHGYSEAYTSWFAGAAVHLDYALTGRLVLRGRAGWAELVGGRMSATNASRDFHLGSRAGWDGGLALDYRLTRSIHLTTGADYTYYSFGRTRDVSARNGEGSLYEPASWTSGVRMHLGAAWAF